MNGLDTNVLIRYLVADDEAQAGKAKRYIESGPSYVNCIVLCEAVLVLESAYGYGKDAIASMLERLLSTHEVAVEDADLALGALHDYRQFNAGFTDCLIRHRNAAHGCSETGSFDKRAKSIAGFKLL